MKIKQNIKIELSSNWINIKGDDIFKVKILQWMWQTTPRLNEYRKGSDILATIFVLFFGRFSGKWALSALSDSWSIDLMFFVEQKVT